MSNNLLKKRILTEFSWKYFLKINVVVFNCYIIIMIIILHKQKQVLEVGYK